MREEVNTLPLIHQVLSGDGHQQKLLYVPVMHQNQDIHMLRVRDMQDFETFDGTRNPFAILEPPEETLHLRSNLIQDLRTFARQNGGSGEKGATAEVPGPKVLVVTPGLAFDRSGRRLGRGKGYYDRFIRSLRDEMKTLNQSGVVGARLTMIAPVFPCQIVDEVPADPSHDEIVDIIYTTTATEDCIDSLIQTNQP